MSCAVLLATTGCDDDEADSGAAEPAPAALTPRADPPIEVGGVPVAIAADDQGVWVVDNSGSLLRLDPDRLEQDPDRIPIAGGPAAVAIGEGAVWVASGDGSITSVDPANGKSTRFGERVTQPGGIAVGEGAVWVTSSAGNGLVRIDPASGEVVGEPIDVGEFPTDVAVGDGSVWVANSRDGTVTRLDAASGEADEQIEVGEGGEAEVLALAVGEGGVWVARSDGLPGSEIAVVRIDPDSGTVEGDPAPVDAAIPVRIAAGEGGVWTTLVGGPTPLQSEQPPTVALIDPATGQVAGETIAVGERPSGIATGAGAVWVANAGDGTVTRIEPSG